MTTELFTDQKDDQVQIDPNKKYFEELVGENKKFKDQESLARGKWEADEFIRTKNREYDLLREDYLKLREEHNAVPKLQELIDRLSKQQTSSEQTQANNLDNKQAAIDPKEIENLVTTNYQKMKAQETQENNYNHFVDKLQEVYGESYKSFLNSQMKELGLTQEYIVQNARLYPKALLKTLGVGDKASANDLFQAPIRTQVNSFKPTTPSKRTWSYYQTMRREQPELYSNSKTQLQMHRDHAELGREFEDGNWSSL